MDVEDWAGNVIATTSEPTVEPLAVECKFTVEHKEGLGGDFESNFGGTNRQRRIEFEGNATMDVMRELAEAIRAVAGDTARRRFRDAPRDRCGH